MRTIYIDSEMKCHTSNDGTMTPAETSFFDGKCDTFVEGYCYDIDSRVIYPWKDHSKLDDDQRNYERQLISEYEAALAESVRLADLDAAYQEGVNAAYDR